MKKIISILFVFLSISSFSQTCDPSKIADYAENGETNMVNCALDKGANVESKNKRKMTALMMAAYSGNVDTVKLLLDRGANIKTISNPGSMLNSGTALLEAIVSCNNDVIKLLLDRGASVELKDNGATLFASSVTNCDIDTIKLLINYDTDIKAKKNLRTKAFISAIISGKWDIVVFLLSNGNNKQKQQ